LAKKKMYKLVNSASSFKTLLVQGRANNPVTVRHSIPATVSIAEKSSDFPDDGLSRLNSALRGRLRVASDLRYVG